MYFAERALMRRHAELLLGRGGTKDLLEVGFGLGVFAEEAHRIGLRSHTIVEVHPARVAAALDWRAGLKRPEKVRIIGSAWQESINELGRYNAIMYDATSPPGCGDLEFGSFVRAVCNVKLRRGGVFSFWNPGKNAHPEKEEQLRRQFRVIRKYPFRMTVVPKVWCDAPHEFTIVIAVVNGCHLRLHDALEAVGRHLTPSLCSEAARHSFRPTCPRRRRSLRGCG